ncbi:hypothetical protein EJ110_NYTH41015 [Nymphaea thermarum]|nr:hypothetical protein EJ110_NYTH41015 [Nymphaea thermarum]
MFLVNSGSHSRASSRRSTQPADFPSSSLQRLVTAVVLVGTGAATPNSSVAPSSSAPTLGQPQVRSLGSTQDNPKVEQGTPLQSPSSHQQRNKLPQQERHYVVPQSGKTIPTYLDEFKNGFPMDGLSSVSVRWWGNVESDDKDALSEKESVENEPPKDSTAKTGEGDCEDDKNTHSEKERVNNEPSKGSIAKTGEANHEDDQASTPVVGAPCVTVGNPCVTSPCNMENLEAQLEGASLLSAIRKKNAEDGTHVLKLGISRGYGTSRLSKRQKLLLSEIFRSSLPSQWRYSMF